MTQTKRRLWLAPILSAAALVPFAIGALAPVTAFGPAGCGGGNGNLPPPPPAPSALPTFSSPVASSSAPQGEDAGAPAPKPPEVQLVSGAAAPDPAEKPTVKIAAPAKDQLIAANKASDFEIKLDVKKWPTAQGDAHVHLILDNSPYKAIYDTKKPIKMSELPGGDKLAEGQHVLIAFPSRASHESVKTPGALAIVEFYVGAKKGARTVDTTKPILIYSRPKGDYKGEMANHVLIDFQLANVTLAEGKEHVHIKVTGPGIDGSKEADATKFGPPFYLDNLQTGTYTVNLQLLGADKNRVAAAYNDTSRTIQIDRSATPTP